MLRLKEVASQSEMFSKRVLENRVNQLIAWMAQVATTAKCFLLTGRLYWLLGVDRIRVFSLRASQRWPQILL